MTNGTAPYRVVPFLFGISVTVYTEVGPLLPEVKPSDLKISLCYTRRMAKATTLNEIGEMLRHLVDHTSNMATTDDLVNLVTKDDLEAFRQETNENFRLLRREVADIRRELEALQIKVSNIEGYRKEIDHALERISRIEKHIGIDKKATA